MSTERTLAYRPLAMMAGALAALAWLGNSPGAKEGASGSVCLDNGSREYEAISISANIQARHAPFATILDPIFAAPDSNRIAGYTRCGDSAIWTGHYLAAEAFRYKVTGSGGALANAKRALDGLTLLVNVTGTDLLARCAVPRGSPYARGIALEEAANGVWFGSAAGLPYMWIGNTSRDQYAGVFFGLGVAYDLFEDKEIREHVSALATRLLKNLVDHGWNIVMPNGAISTTFLLRPDQQLTLLRIGEHLNPAAFERAYSASTIEAAVVFLPIGLEATDTASSYFKFNLDAINFFHLVPGEPNPFRRMVYHGAYGALRGAVVRHQNAHFNMIDRALNGPNAERDTNTVAYLEQWRERPRRDFFVDLRGAFRACGSQACEPIPIARRVPTDFLWQRNPFQLSGGGRGLIESAGIDYILPYWMARYYGVLAN